MAPLPALLTGWLLDLIVLPSLSSRHCAFPYSSTMRVSPLFLLLASALLLLSAVLPVSAAAGAGLSAPLRRWARGHIAADHASERDMNSKQADMDTVATVVVPESAFAPAAPAVVSESESESQSEFESPSAFSASCPLQCLSEQSACLEACNSSGGGMDCFNGCVAQNAGCMQACQH